MDGWFIRVLLFGLTWLGLALFMGWVTHSRTLNGGEPVDSPEALDRGRLHSHEAGGAVCDCGNPEGYGIDRPYPNGSWKRDL
jgi:hypothetical protein